MLALSNGLNMDFGTRDTNTDEPWIRGHTSIEGCDFVEDTEGTTYIFFGVHPYKWRTADQNRETLDEEMQRIEEFINNHKQTKK